MGHMGNGLQNVKHCQPLDRGTNNLHAVQLMLLPLHHLLHR